MARGTATTVVVDVEGDELPPGSPLAGTPGGAVALATRRLLNRIRAMIASGGDEGEN
jgi:hypothetical protein